MLIRYILFSCVGGFLFILLLSQYLTFQEAKFLDRIYPNVYVDSRHVGQKTREEASLPYQKKNTELSHVNIEVLYKNEPIATLSAEKINLHSNGEEIVERAYLISRSSHLPSKMYQKLATLLYVKPFTFESKITYNQGAINEFIEGVEEQYDRPAKNALFEYQDGKVTSFREDEKGTKINSDVFKKDFDTVVNELNSKVSNKKIILTESTLEPEITLKGSNNFGIEELIGEGKSVYQHSIPERIHNLTLASSKLHGVLIPKDKVFSFNDVIGDISSLTGYKPAYVIKNGRTVLGDGGGVCQVSTTLYRAALNAGLPIIERTEHAYRASYYELDSKPGLDATIFGPTVDFKFKNDTGSPILIQVEQDFDNTILSFKFYGKKDGRRVELSDIRVYDQQPPPPALYQDDPTLPKGVVKQVDFAAWGAKSSYTYKVTKQDGTVYEKTFNSVYRPWQAVYLVGTQ